jgi:hypothetical protein
MYLVLLLPTFTHTPHPQTHFQNAPSYRSNRFPAAKLWDWRDQYKYGRTAYRIANYKGLMGGTSIDKGYIWRKIYGDKVRRRGSVVQRLASYLPPYVSKSTNTQKVRIFANYVAFRV